MVHEGDHPHPDRRAPREPAAQGAEGARDRARPLARRSARGHGAQRRAGLRRVRAGSSRDARQARALALVPPGSARYRDRAADVRAARARVMSAARILAAYRAIFGTLIVVASIQTLVAAPAHHVALPAAVEIAAALMLMWRRTQWVGASVLLAVFACAQVLSAVEGAYPTRFLQ